jgi:ATP-dependent Lon protease
VLPVGGVKEKVLAAHRAGIKRVILPERCVGDLDEVPQEVRDELEFIPVSKMDEVLLAALEEPGKLDLKLPEPSADEASTPKQKKGKTRDRVTGTPPSVP